MFKKSRILFTALMLSLIFFSSILVSAQGVETPTFPGKYQNGVGNITIYIDYASGAGYWSTYIRGGANNWMYPGSGMENPIYIKFVESNYGSNMDFYSKNQSHFDKIGASNALAITEFYDNNEVRILYGERNWYYAKILINDDKFRQDWFTNDQAQGTIIHEMGHAFGLAHNNTNPHSVMCQTKHGRIAQRVQIVDNEAVKGKYR